MNGFSFLFLSLLAFEGCFVVDGLLYVIAIVVT